jgi:hypothetical protein
MSRLMRDWRALGSEQRLAGGAAAALLASMLLPWYQQNAVVSAPRTSPLQSRDLNAFQVFSFIEAAVLLVAVAIIYLLYARAEGHTFRLPGSDGAVVLVAGLWAAVLLILRLFDKPGISSHGVAANVGVQWGIFFALAGAGLLAYAGSRMRAAHRPEPPVSRAAQEPPLRPGRPRYPPAPPSGPPPVSARRSRPPTPPRSPIVASRRPVAAPKATEQLSLEDPPPETGHGPS